MLFDEWCDGGWASDEYPYAVEDWRENGCEEAGENGCEECELE
jgi:hypothetical protein